MDYKIAGSLRCYFETLYDLNRNLIKCCGADIFDDSIEYGRLLRRIIEDIPKLTPYIRDKSTQELKIASKDGLLEFSDKLPYLADRYQSLLDKHREFLSKVKDVRNKLEHRMQDVKYLSSGSSPFTMFVITYSVGEKEIPLQAEEFIAFIKELNLLYYELQREVGSFAFENKVEGHGYYVRLLRFDFRGFNRIFESDLLVTFGMTLYSF